MKLLPLDQLNQMAVNRYEAVLIAAKRARLLNKKRKADQDQQALENTANETRRLTSRVLEELLMGQIKFVRMRESLE